MIKKYKYNYDYHKASVEFEVDTEKFNSEMAKSTLTFFTWDYDKEADPVDEVMKKYAIAAIESATFNNYNAYGVKSDFEQKEGFGSINGEIGITLLDVSGFEFDDHELTLED